MPGWNSATQLLTALKNLVTGVFDSLTGISSKLGLTGLLKYAGSEGGMLLGRMFNLSDEAALAALKSNADAIVKIGDDLAEAGIELSDEAAGGLGKLATALPEDNFQRIVHNLCPSGLTLVNDHRTVGLASPLVAPACNVNFQKILENVVNLDEAGLEGLEKLAKADVDEALLAFILSKYADDVDLTNKVFKIFGETSETSSKLLKIYTKNAVELVGRYEDGGLKALDIFREQAVGMLNKYKDDLDAQEHIKKYLKNVTDDAVVDMKLTKVSLTQGFQVQELLRKYNIEEIHITGRLADTPGEAATRRFAWNDAESLIVFYKNKPDSLPDEVLAQIDLFPLKEDEIIEFWVKNEVAENYHNLTWPQVKVSTGDSEVDVFIPEWEWKNLSRMNKKTIGKNLKEIFNVRKVDFYQDITPENWELTLRKYFTRQHDPRYNIPPGSISLEANGTIEHTLLGVP